MVQRKYYKVVTPSGKRYLSDNFRNKREARVAIRQMIVGAAYNRDTRAIMHYARAKIRRVWKR